MTDTKQDNRSQEKDALAEARESYSGRLLTDAQFREAIAIVDIIDGEIQNNGTFKEKLGDYAHAYARTKPFDAVKAETTLRDLFKARTGQTMNEFRKELAAREEALTPADKRDPADTQHIKDMIHKTGIMIRDGDKMTFHRACEQQASVLAHDYGITTAAAKRLMAETFQAEQGSKLYDWGKELEDEYYRPQIEAEKQEREAQSQKRSNGRSTTRETEGAPSRRFEI